MWGRPATFDTFHLFLIEKTFDIEMNVDTELERTLEAGFQVVIILKSQAIT